MRSWGTGSKNQMVVQSLGAIISGVAGGNAAQVAAGGLNPWVAQLIKKETTDAEGNVNVAANAAAHAVWGAVAAQMAGGNAAAGAAGAFSGELAARYIAEHYYHVDLSEPGSQLSEDQRQELSLMSTLAAGLAGGLAGNSTASATTGAQAGKNAVENNALSDLTDALAAGKTPQRQAEERVEAENERYKKENCAGMSAEACTVKMYTQRREELKEILLTGADFVPVAGTLKSAAEAESALDYLETAATLIPGGWIAGKIFKAARAALKNGDVAEASKLINKASEEVSATLPRNLVNQPSNTIKQVSEGNQVAGIMLPGKKMPDVAADIGKVDSASENIIKNDILDNPRVGGGEKGSGSGNKVDQLPNKAVTDIDGKEISIYPDRIKPTATQEFPSVPKSHGFSDIVDNYAGTAVKTPLNNGATLYQLEGSLNGVSGRFEWILDPKLGGISHRMFVSGGKVNGVPSKP